MPLECFPLLRDNTRLIRYKDFLYKVKVRYDAKSFTGTSVQFSETIAHDEIEQVFRAVVYITERDIQLKPIQSQHFIITPLKIPWSFTRKHPSFHFLQHGKRLSVVPYVFDLFVKLRQDVQSQAGSTGMQEQQANTASENETDHKIGQTLTVPVEGQVVGTPRFGRTADGRWCRLVPQGAQMRVHKGSCQKVHDSNKQSTNKEKLSPQATRNNQSMKRKLNEAMNSSKTEIDERSNSKLRKLTGEESSKQRNNKESSEKQQNADKKQNISVVDKSHLDRHVKVRNYQIKSPSSSSSECDEKGTAEKANQARSVQTSNFQTLSSDRGEKRQSGLRHSPRKLKRNDRQSGNRRNLSPAQFPREKISRKAKNQIISYKISDTNESESQESDRNQNEAKEKSHKQMLRNNKKDKSQKSEQSANDHNKRLSDRDNKDSDKTWTENNSNRGSSSSTAPDEDTKIEDERDSRKVLRRSGRLADQDFDRDQEGSRGVQDDRHLLYSEDAPSSQESGREGGKGSRKLYRINHSPLVRLPLYSGQLSNSSPQVSTVRPLKRDAQHRQHGDSSTTALRVNLTALTDDHMESARLAALRSREITSSSAPDVAGLDRITSPAGSTHRQILLSQRRDRHVVEQAERAEEAKLRQLYEPVRRSPRLIQQDLSDNMSNNPSHDQALRNHGLSETSLEENHGPTKRHSFGLIGRLMDSFMGKK